MANPFPGMNPYLEDRALWNDFHARLAVYISNQLQPQVRPRYVTRVEARIYLEFAAREIVPDVALLRRKSESPDKGVAVMEPECDAPLILQVVETPRTERAVHIYDRENEMRLVTVIEVLSPSNKDTRSDGRELYLRKQQELLHSEVNLVEIDLLRGGDYTLAAPLKLLQAEAPSGWHYLIGVNCYYDRERYYLYPRTVRERLPVIPIPLLADDKPAKLDVQAVVEQCYADGAYEMSIDYRRAPPLPAFSADDAQWIDALLREKGVRLEA
jgi:hypothetical protein